MLSGNGRHRRPRQAPAIVVAAGVTGSAIAIPLLGASGAHAADGVTWDRLAECESGGDWSAVPGNGHYGGLQLSQSTWVSYGGLDYAESPDRASRSEQIAIAERVLSGKGPSAWPGCAILAGLTADEGPEPSTSPSDSSGASGSESPDPVAGSDISGEQPDSGGSGESSHSSGSSDSASPSASGAPEPSGTSGGAEGGGGSAGAQGAGRHRGGPAGDEGRGDAAGRHASRGDAVHGTYVVHSGDNLWSIAREHDLKGGWPALYAANRETVGEDPDLILPGQRLDLR